MTARSDLETVRLCAQAMGIWHCSDTDTDFVGRPPVATISTYDPLHDKAQAMELVIAWPLDIRYTNQWIVSGWYSGSKTGMALQHEVCNPNNLLRAICECVAEMQSAKNASRGGAK